MAHSVVLVVLLSVVNCDGFFSPRQGSDFANADLITHLPGLDQQTKFAQYSGYLKGSTENYQLHYWFIEAEKNPESAPLVLWLNGGPGCSSMEGLLKENGPFNVRPHAKLEPNPHSWNKIANMLYLEAPAGVGYSFALDGNATTDDDLTSLNNYHALLSFLQKFPQFKDRDFYITGESYGGFYVPLLALRVLQNRPNGLNLKGIAVGNGLTNSELNDNSQLYYLNYHGIVDESVWKDLLENCCDSQCATKCMFTRKKTLKCDNSVSHIVSLTDGLNAYNLYQPCYGGVESVLDRFKHAFGLGGSRRSFRPEIADLSSRRLLHRTARSEHRERLYLSCMDESVIMEYLNNPEVRRALHIDARATYQWVTCDDRVYYNYVRLYNDMSEAYLKIMDNSVHVMLYAGDIDSVCNFLGILWFVDGLGLPMTKPMKHYLYDDLDGTKQIGGFYKVLQHQNKANLTYVTIRGAGHMVPEDKPVVALKIFADFLHNREL